MTEPQTVLKVIVGSRLHNLFNENSDYDIRGIFLHPLIDIISPFRKPKNTQWIEGDEDNTAYELREFCKMATQGNPTILEILYSNQVKETSELGRELQDNRHKFLDTTRIFEAVKGYSHNQYNKMNLFEPDARTPKFAVAYCRAMFQAAELLRTGEITCEMMGEFRDFLMDVKYNFRKELIPILSEKFAELQVDLANAHQSNHGKFKPNIPWIEEFLIRAYKEK